MECVAWCGDYRDTPAESREINVGDEFIRSLLYEVYVLTAAAAAVAALVIILIGVLCVEADYTCSYYTYSYYYYYYYCCCRRDESVCTGVNGVTVVFRLRLLLVVIAIGKMVPICTGKLAGIYYDGQCRNRFIIYGIYRSAD